MRVQQAVMLALPALASAYPGMMGASSRAEMEQNLRRAIEQDTQQKREAAPQLSNILNPIGNLVGSLGDLVGGLLNSVGNAIVVADNKRPEEGFEFRAPGDGDSRGPCPGLNLLANYGYLPRDGYVNFGQVLEATSRGFNMGTDLSTVLATFAVLGSGDLDGLSFYLGSGKNGIGGLNRHSVVEADVSPNREGISAHISSMTPKTLTMI